MSYGKMNTFIDIVEKVTMKDAEGFRTEVDNIIASVKAYREGRHGNEKWANRSTFSEATDLFRLFCIGKAHLIMLAGTRLIRLQRDEFELGWNRHIHPLPQIFHPLPKA